MCGHRENDFDLLYRRQVGWMREGGEQADSASLTYEEDLLYKRMITENRKQEWPSGPGAETLPTSDSNCTWWFWPIVTFMWAEGEDLRRRGCVQTGFARSLWISSASCVSVTWCLNQPLITKWHDNIEFVHRSDRITEVIQQSCVRGGIWEHKRPAVKMSCWLLHPILRTRSFLNTKRHETTRKICRAAIYSNLL